MDAMFIYEFLAISTENKVSLNPILVKSYRFIVLTIENGEELVFGCVLIFFSFHMQNQVPQIVI